MTLAVSHRIASGMRPGTASNAAASLSAMAGGLRRGGDDMIATSADAIVRFTHLFSRLGRRLFLRCLKRNGGWG